MSEKAKVSIRALEARIRRALEKDGQLLKKSRVDSRFFSELGEYYIVNQHNAVEAKHCDLARLAKELDVLKPYEESADE